MEHLNNAVSNPKPERKLYLSWLFILLSSVLLSISGGVMITALYIQALGVAALVALLLSRSKSQSLRIRRVSYNFLVAFLLLGSACVIVILYNMLFVI